MAQYEDLMQRLESLASSDNLAGMARFGINTLNARGISLPDLRRLAKEAGADHGLAQQLWASRVHEARILASIVDEPGQVTEEQMEHWVRDFDSWDICDQVCSNLFDRTGFAHRKAAEWSRREEEFVKRAGFALMASLAVHDKAAPDSAFEAFLPLIKQQAADERNFVRKAVNWALRNIGKRNVTLNGLAVTAARDIQRLDSRSARWIAADAIRELVSEKVQTRLRGSKAEQALTAPRRKTA